MIAIDTNVLIRYLVQDEPRQARLANQLIDAQLTADARGFVSLTVMCEIAWVLQSNYRLSRARIVDTLSVLLVVSQLEVEEPEIILAAMDDVPADMGDAIIHEIGRARGCARTVTFDRRFARLEGVELLA